LAAALRPTRTAGLGRPVVLAALLLWGCGGEREHPPAANAPQPAGTPAAAPAAEAATGEGGAYAAGTVTDGGRIAGRILYKGAPRPPRPIQVTKDNSVCGAVAHTDESLVVGPDGGVRHAVVSIGSITRGKPWPTSAGPSLDQHACWFIPHVQVIPAGATLDVVNSDGILHNIHTYPKNNPPANMAQPKFKKTLQLPFQAPDVVKVNCDVHSWMSAWIVVAAHPYYAVSDEHGAFTLEGVPPGTYTLRAWHETLGTREQPITVPPGGAAEATITFQE